MLQLQHWRSLPIRLHRRDIQRPDMSIQVRMERYVIAMDGAGVLQRPGPKRDGYLDLPCPGELRVRMECDVRLAEAGADRMQTDG